MEQEQNSESDEGFKKGSVEESRTVIGYDEGIIGDTHYGEDQQDHDGA
jgi:hypothetical protein